MGKIRINELARQLEVPSHEILEMLPGLGVTEKKTHSSSVDDHVAEEIRRILHGDEGRPLRDTADSNGAGAVQAEPEAPVTSIAQAVAEPISETHQPQAVPVSHARRAPEHIVPESKPEV